MVHILAAMESCRAYRPWFDRATGPALLEPNGGTYLLCYFDFIDADIARCYVRVPPWAPVHLPVYLNGHAWLAQQPRAIGRSSRIE